MNIKKFLKNPKSYCSPSYIKRRFFSKTISVPWYGLHTDDSNKPKKLTFCAEGLISNNYFGGQCDEDFQLALGDVKSRINQKLYFEWRIYFYLQILLHQLEKCNRENTDFIYMECGVGEAHMLSVVHAYLDRKGGKFFDIFSKSPKILMDTFAGVDHSLLTEKYQHLKEVTSSKAYFGVTLDKLKSNLSHINNITYVQGSIPASLESLSLDFTSPSFLHIDMNNPPPEVAALDFFYPRMITGSAIIFDDYGHPGFEDQNQAINDWCDIKTVPRPINIPTGQGLIVK